MRHNDRHIMCFTTLGLNKTSISVTAIENNSEKLKNKPTDFYERK